MGIRRTTILFVSLSFRHNSQGLEGSLDPFRCLPGVQRSPDGAKPDPAGQVPPHIETSEVDGRLEGTNRSDGGAVVSIILPVDSEDGALKIKITATGSSAVSRIRAGIPDQ